MSEILVDKHYRTNVEGIYAVGDNTTVPYKQVAIAIRRGLKTVLTAFDDSIGRGKH